MHAVLLAALFSGAAVFALSVLWVSAASFVRAYVAIQRELSLDRAPQTCRVTVRTINVAWKCAGMRRGRPLGRVRPRPAAMPALRAAA